MLRLLVAPGYSESLLMQSNRSRRIRPSDLETALGERFMAAAIAWTSIASEYR